MSSAEVPRVAIVSGASIDPNYARRVRQHAQGYVACGVQVSEVSLDEASARDMALDDADIVHLWGVRGSASVIEAVARARGSGARVILDLGDPLTELAHADSTSSETGEFASELLSECDALTCPTSEIATRLQRFASVTFVLPDGYDDVDLRDARQAVRARALRSALYEPLRLGFLKSPSPRDLAVVFPALQRVLRERPACRMADENDAADLDVHVLPCDVADAYSSAASERAFLVASLVGVPTVASPAISLRAAVRSGETGLLADNEEKWYETLLHLVDDVVLRARLGRNAHLDVLWRYGAGRRMERVAFLLEMLLGEPRRAARAFELEYVHAVRPPARLPEVPESETLFHSDSLGRADVTVVVPLYNYARYVERALESVRAQTLDAIDLVVVDDCSTDTSAMVAERWMHEHAERFNRLLLLRNTANAGLARTRNAGFATAETPYVLPLDADNELLPECAVRCLEAITRNGAAFAYPRLRRFGEDSGVMGALPFSPIRLAGGNVIDAMALVRKDAWSYVGGYETIRFPGWEDYDLWCKFAERGLFGVHVPQELALYRVHGDSMLHRETDVTEHKRRLIAEMLRRHPWLLLERPATPARSEE